MSDKPETYLTGDWVTTKYDPMTGIETQMLDLGTHLAVRSVYHPTDQLFSANAERRIDSQNKRWGDGAVAAEIPLNLYFDKFAEARKNNDQKYISKILNDSDYRNLRTKEGKI
jgi:hypothetical protein